MFYLKVACIAVGGLLCALRSAEAADERPNILFIMSDDHAYQAMSCYGSRVNETPNLDRIAQEGMRFDRCFVTNSICGPARAVILTGKYSHLNGFVRNGNRFNGAQQNVAKLLQQAGYQTAVIGKWHLGSDPTGFDDWHILVGQGPYYNPPMKTPGGIVQHTGYTTDVITDETLGWLQEKRDESQPFFLVYQHKAPHRNWQPGPKYLNKYDNIQIPEPATLFDDYAGRGSAAKSQEMTIARHLNPHDLKLTDQRASFTEEQLAAWQQAYGEKNKTFESAGLEGDALTRWKYQRFVKDYLRCIDSVDENVGRVLDYLDESGLAENTIVIYTSDQGWYLGEHGWYDKRWMYEESFRTPLIVRWPGKVAAGTSTDKMVMNLDFAETFLDIAGAEVPKDMQGHSLVPILREEQTPEWRRSVYYHYYEFPGPHAVQKHYGVRTERYKLIRFYEIDEWELFDLEKDPHELRSVYAHPAYAKIATDLKQELERLRDQYQDDGQIVDFEAQRAKQVKLQLAAAFDFGALDAAVRKQGTIVDGWQGKAVRLDGKQTAAIVPTGEKLDPTYKPLTVGGWIYPAGDGVIAAQGGAGLGYSLFVHDDTLQFSMRQQGQLRTLSGPRIPQRDWSHVAAVLDAEGVVSFRVNGQAEGPSAAWGFIPSRPADNLSIGADSGSLVGPYETPAGFHGLLEDIRVYWGVLDAASLREWSTP